MPTGMRGDETVGDADPELRDKRYHISKMSPVV